MGKIPTVIHGRMESDGEIIELNSPKWREWLSLNTSFRYEPSSQPGFTVRLEKSVYWCAYRKAQGKLHKRYIGKVEEVTQERLEEIAVLLNEPAQPRLPKVTDKVTDKTSVTKYATNEDIAQLWGALGELRQEVAALGKLKAR